MTYFVQLRDSKSGRDAFIRMDLPHVTSKLAAWFVAESQLAEAKFEVVDVSEVHYIPVEFAQEIDLGHVEQGAEC